MPKAKDIMTSPAFTVGPDMSVRELAEKLIERNYSGAPVVDANGDLVGIVTESDLVEQHKRVHLPTLITVFDSVLAFEGHFDLKGQIKKMLGSKASDIMVTPVVTVDEDMELEDIATIMSEQNKHLIPVVCGDKVVGIIGKADMVRAIVKSE